MELHFLINLKKLRSDLKARTRGLEITALEENSNEISVAKPLACIYDNILACIIEVTRKHKDDGVKMRQ